MKPVFIVLILAETKL